MQVNIQQSTSWKRWAGGSSQSIAHTLACYFGSFLISPNETQSPTHFAKKSHTHTTQKAQHNTTFSSQPQFINFFDPYNPITPQSHSQLTNEKKKRKKETNMSVPDYDFNGDHDDDGMHSHFPKNKFESDLNSKIMLTAIVSLSGVIVLVVALHIYARCVLRRQARQRFALRQLGLTVAHVRSNEPPKTGLDPLVIQSLPMFVFKQRDAEDGAASTIIECAVCLSVLEKEEIARLLPNCKHIFHAECIDKWLSSHSTCPICRTEAEPRVLPVPREGPAGLAAGGGGGAPNAPPMDRVNSGLSCMEGTSYGLNNSSEKVSGSSSRLNSFKRMLSREKSLKRIHSCGEDDDTEDLERQ